MAELRRFVPRDLPVRYAGASLDFNPIHLFDDAAQAAGLPGVVLHGMCTLAWAIDAVERAAGATVVTFGGRFAAPVPVGATLTFSAEPEGEGYTVRARTEAGEEVLKAARANVRPEPPEATTLPTEGPHAAVEYAVGREKIREFRAAVGVEGPAEQAPPTFGAAAVCRGAVFTVIEQVGLPLAGTIHGGMQLWLGTPLCEGEVVRAEAAVLSDQSRGGLRRMVVRSLVIGPEGGPRLLADWTLLRRG